MNEALVEACLRVARLTHDLAEARAELRSAIRAAMKADGQRRMDAQQKTAPGWTLSKSSSSEGLADQALGAID